MDSPVDCQGILIHSMEMCAFWKRENSTTKAINTPNSGLHTHPLAPTGEPRGSDPGPHRACLTGFLLFLAAP